MGDKKAWKRRRRLRDVDAAGLLDRSEILYSFPDGWTIRKPSDVVDLAREGSLMDTCLRCYVDFDEEDYADPDVKDGAGGMLYFCRSVRDPDNHPRVTFAYGGLENEIFEVRGRGDTVPKPEYVEYVLWWAASLPDPPAVDLSPPAEKAAAAA